MNIAIIGYGKMGRMIEEIAKQRGHNIVCIIDQDNQADFDSPAFASADVAIEFTTPQAAFDNYRKAFAHNVKVVSGSTGWLVQHGEEVRKMCQEEGQTLFWASNFSIGVAIFQALNRRWPTDEPLSAIQCAHRRNPSCAQTRRTFGHGHYFGRGSGGTTRPQGNVG